MRISHAAAIVGLLLYQAAPLPVVQDETGTVRISFGAGTGRFEEPSFDCAGNFVSSDPVDVRSSAGVLVEAFPSEHLRVAASLSAATTRYAVASGSSGREGAVAGFIAYERAGWGLGGGLQVREDPSSPDVLPVVYLRLGSLDGLHYRTEILAPTETHLLTSPVRVGAAWGGLASRRVAGFVGVGLPEWAGGLQSAVLFADLAVPVARHWSLLPRAQAGPGYDVPQWGVSLGLRTTLGPRRGGDDRDSRGPGAQ